MYDDVLRWMGSWYIIYPLLIVLSFVGFSVAIGLFYKSFQKISFLFLGYKELPKIVFENVLKQLNSLFGKKVLSAAVKVGLR